MAGDIERSQARIAGLRMLVDGVDVSTMVDEELHTLDGEHIGNRGVHEWRSAEGVIAVGVGSVIEKGADVPGVGKYDSVIK